MVCVPSSFTVFHQPDELYRFLPTQLPMDEILVILVFYYHRLHSAPLAHLLSAGYGPGGGGSGTEFCRWRCRSNKNAAAPSTIATPATTPTTILAIAPPDRDAEEGEVFATGVGLGVEVTKINECGSKPQVVAAADAALKEYVLLSAWLLMLRSGLCCLFQQMLICLSWLVHISLYCIPG